MTLQNDDQQQFWTNDAGPSWVARMTPMDKTLGPVLDEVLRVADIQKGAQVVDIGCGAGTSTLRAAALAGASGAACGVDISRTLLDAAERQALNLANVQFQLADAQTFDFEDARFDHLISRFGVMFFADPVAAFANMGRSLKPNGRVTFATWGAIPENPYFTLPAQIAKEVIGQAPKSDPDLPGPFAFRDVDRVTSILADAGYVDISAVETPLDLTPDGTVEAVADVLCDIGAAQRVLLHFEADAHDRARLVKALTKALLPFETPQGVRLPALINIFSARKPA